MSHYVSHYDFFSQIVDEISPKVRKAYLVHAGSRGWVWFTTGGSMIPVGFTHLYYDDQVFESPRGFEIDCPFGRTVEQCHYLDEIDRFAKDAGFKVFGTGAWNSIKKLVAPTEADAVLLSGFVTVLQHEVTGVG